MILLAGYGLYYIALEFFAGLSWVMFIGTPMFLTANLLRQVRRILQRVFVATTCRDGQVLRFVHACSNIMSALLTVCVAVPWGRCVGDSGLSGSCRCCCGGVAVNGAHTLSRSGAAIACVSEARMTAPLLGVQESQHAWAWSLAVNLFSWYMQVRPDLPARLTFRGRLCLGRPLTSITPPSFAVLEPFDGLDIRSAAFDA